MQLILASRSRYRRTLLETLRIPFECHTPEVDETQKSGESAQELVFRLAQKKAEAVAQVYPSHLIIGSDQSASIAGNLLHKPGKRQVAVDQLTRCSGQKVTFFTGLCLFNSRSGRVQCQSLPFEVTFRHLSSQQINSYIDKEQPMDCAGSFKCEGLGIALFEKFEGDDPNILIGLPLMALTTMLLNENVDVLSMCSGSVFTAQ